MILLVLLACSDSSIAEAPGQPAGAQPLTEEPLDAAAPSEAAPEAVAPLAEPPTVEGVAGLPEDATPKKPPVEGAGGGNTAAGEGDAIVDPVANPPTDTPPADPAAMDPLTNPPRYDPNTQARPEGWPDDGGLPPSAEDQWPGAGPNPDPQRSQTDPDLSPFGDLYRVEEVPTLSGSTLSLAVSYGGGCGEHSWTASEVAVEDGVEVVRVIHDAGGDGCRAIKRARVALDLVAQGVGFCGKEVLAIEVAVGVSGASPARYTLGVDPALSACEEAPG